MGIVLVFSVIGSYAIRNSFFDVYIMTLFGVIGYFFEFVDILGVFIPRCSLIAR